MRFLRAATALLLAAASVNAHEDTVQPPLVTLWPLHTTSSLVFQPNAGLFSRLGANLGLVQADEGWRVDTKGKERGMVVAFAGEAKVPIEEPSALPESVRSIELTWSVGANATTTTTMDRVFGAAAGALPGFYAEGLHIRVLVDNVTRKAVEEEEAEVAKTNATESVETNVTETSNVTVVKVPAVNIQEIENAVRLLWSTVQLTPVADITRGGFLAPALCASNGFRVIPPSDVFCFSSAIALPKQFKFNVFQNLSTVPSLDALDQHRNATWAAMNAPRMRVVSLQLVPASPSRDTLDVSLLSAWTTASKRVTNKMLPVNDVNVAMVSMLQREGAYATFVPVVGDNLIGARLQLHTVSRAPVLADANVSIEGRGFHRNVHFDVALDAWPAKCDEDMKVLTVVVLPPTAYADLDELRRLERFHQLKLHSMEKHIEIERPSAVSSQHMLAVEFAINRTEYVNRTDVGMSMDVPIHLRYQSPSNVVTYANAALIAPQLFFSCQPYDVEPKETVTHSPPTNPTDQFITTWLRGSAREWRRLIPIRPFALAPVSVPVGALTQGTVVSFFTVAATMFAALVLAFVAITHCNPGFTESSPALKAIQETSTKFIVFVQEKWSKCIVALKATYTKNEDVIQNDEGAADEGLEERTSLAPAAAASEVNTEVTSSSQVETVKHIDSCENSADSDVKRVVKVQRRTTTRTTRVKKVVDNA